MKLKDFIQNLQMQIPRTRHSNVWNLTLQFRPPNEESGQRFPSDAAVPMTYET